MMTQTVTSIEFPTPGMISLAIADIWEVKPADGSIFSVSTSQMIFLKNNIVFHDDQVMRLKN